MSNVQCLKQVLEEVGWELGLQNVLQAALRPTKVESVLTIFMGVNCSSRKWQCCTKYSFIVLQITPAWNQNISRMNGCCKQTWTAGISGPRTTREFCEASFLKFKCLISSLLHRKDDPNNAVSMEGNGHSGCLQKVQQSAINGAWSTEDMTMRRLWEHLTGEEGEYNVSRVFIFLNFLYHERRCVQLRWNERSSTRNSGEERFPVKKIILVWWHKCSL